MRVLVCGGRNFQDAALLNATLDNLHALDEITLVIHGAARGADTLAGRWGAKNNIRVDAYPAHWDEHGKAAGPIRNGEMLRWSRPDMVVAFPGDVGTADMVKKARAAGVTVMEVK